MAMTSPVQGVTVTQAALTITYAALLPTAHPYLPNNAQEVSSATPAVPPNIYDATEVHHNLAAAAVFLPKVAVTDIFTTSPVFDESLYPDPNRPDKFAAPPAG